MQKFKRRHKPPVSVPLSSCEIETPIAIKKCHENPQTASAVWGFIIESSNRPAAHQAAAALRLLSRMAALIKSATP